MNQSFLKLFAILLVFAPISLMADKQADFSKRIHEAFAANDPKAFLELYYLEDTPEKIYPRLLKHWSMFEGREIAEIKYVETESWLDDMVKRDIKIGDATYILNLAPTQSIRILYKPGAEGLPNSQVFVVGVVDGKFLAPGLKLKPADSAASEEK